MAKGANQKIKVLYLMKILLNGTDDEHGLTLQEIAAELSDYGIDAERKTLYDDLETLRLFGLDIEQRRGKNVCYHVVSREFELPELKLLVDAVQSSKFITRKKSNELIKKLEALTSRHEAQQLQRQVFVANRIKTMNESIYYAVSYIHDALNTNVKVSFQYFDWNERKEKQLRHNGKLYCISPWALSWADENYYMIGYDDEQGIIKHYRVDKMQNLCLTEKPREGGALFKNFDMAVYSKATFGMFGGKEEHVVLRCKNHLAGAMLDRFGQEIAFHNVTDSHFEIRVTVQNSPVFLTWLMNFGSDITILSPESVKQAYIRLAKEALSQYE
ncbi:MAG: WYL domain-containing protein [Ruminococcaceae bacterium]|nr:WYL domain-containing protein [Oscillospiraceae bacterium]